MLEMGFRTSRRRAADLETVDAKIYSLALPAAI